MKTDQQIHREYIEKLYHFCKNDNIVQRALIYSRNVKEVKKYGKQGGTDEYFLLQKVKQ